MGKCSCFWILINYSGHLALLIYTAFLFSQHIHQLNNDNFNEWENAWKYRGGMATCLALSVIGFVLIVARILLACNVLNWDFGFAMAFHMITSLIVLVAVTIGAVSLTCDLNNESHRKTCQFYFSWGVIFSGIGLQSCSSIVVPLWIMCVEICTEENEGNDSGHQPPNYPVVLDQPSTTARQPVPEDSDASGATRHLSDASVSRLPHSASHFEAMSQTGKNMDGVHLDDVYIVPGHLFSLMRCLDQSGTQKQTQRSKGTEEIPLQGVDNRGGPERPQCIVCLDHDVEVIILPCGHVCLCQECVNILITSGDKKCPTCRGDIMSVNRCYI